MALWRYTRSGRPGAWLHMKETDGMTHKVRLAGLVLLMAGCAAAQTPDPTFDVASVKVSQNAPSGRDGGGRGMFGGRGGRGNIQASPAGLSMRNVTLKNAVRWAYQVSEY